MRNYFLKKRYLQRYLMKTLIDSASSDVDKDVYQRFRKKRPQFISYRSFCKTQFRQTQQQSGFITNLTLGPCRLINKRSILPQVPAEEYKYRPSLSKDVLFYVETPLSYKTAHRDSFLTFNRTTGRTICFVTYVPFTLSGDSYYERQSYSKKFNGKTLLPLAFSSIFVSYLSFGRGRITFGRTELTIFSRMSSSQMTKDSNKTCNNLVFPILRRDQVRQSKIRNDITGMNTKSSFLQIKLKFLLKDVCIDNKASQKFYKRNEHLKKLHNVYAFLAKHTLVSKKIPFFPYFVSTNYATKTKFLLYNINNIFTFWNKLYNGNVLLHETKVLKKGPLSVRFVTTHVNSDKAHLINIFECKPFSDKIYFRNIYFYVFNFWLMRPLFFITRYDTFYISKTLKLPIYPDRSNLDLRFLRNRLRKQLLPAIRVLLNPQFDAVLSTFSESSPQNL